MATMLGQQPLQIATTRVPAPGEQMFVPYDPSAPSAQEPSMILPIGLAPLGAAIGAFILQHKVGLLVGSLIGGGAGMLYQRWFGDRSPITGSFVGWPDAIALGAGIFALNQIGAFDVVRETIVRPPLRRRRNRRRR